MKRLPVCDWHNMNSSGGCLENQVKYNIVQACESYLNGCYDCGYESMTKQEWADYIYKSIQECFETNTGCFMGKDAAQHLHFYGKANTYKLINYYLDNYDDVKPYIKAAE